MKKIPSLFNRDWEGNRSRVTREVNPECAWVVAGEGVPTRKRDGTACLVRDGVLFRRYDAKQGKTPPPRFQSSQEPDPKTGHHPGWVSIGDGSGDKWHRAAFEAVNILHHEGTYELCGPHFQTNHEGLASDTFILHGSEILEGCPRDFDGLVVYLTEHIIEGIVWHHSDGRMAKIKAADFGLRWPRKQSGS